MKTIIWKELRENLKWAILALLCLTLAEIYSLSHERANPRDTYNNLTLCSSAFLMVTSFGCALFGAALGAVQIVPELRRDQWAALLHRPVSGSVIFFGKVSAGLLLYFLATALPFIASIAYVTAPGQFAAPLVPGMLRPGLSDLLFGAVFYFAAMALSLHHGKWYGSRAVMAVAVVLAFAVHLKSGWPFLTPIGWATVVMLAAWGAMLSRGLVQKRSWPSRTAFVLLLLVGAGWLVLLLGVGLVVVEQWKRPAQAVTFKRFEITRDGQVLVGVSNNNGSPVSLTDMNGKPVTDERYLGNNAYGNFYQLMPMAWSFSKDLGALDRYWSGRPRSLMNYVETANGNSYASNENWYLLIQQNYFAGYDKLSRRCVGIFDSEGFKPAGSAPKPFPVRLRDSLNFSTPYLFWAGPMLYTFDFSGRSMTRFFDAGQDTIYSAMQLRQDRDKPEQIAVALQKEVRVFDAKGVQLVSIPYSHDNWGGLQMAADSAADRFYLVYEPSDWQLDQGQGVQTKSTFLDEIDGHGRVLHSYSFTEVKTPNLHSKWAEQFAKNTLPFMPVCLAAGYRAIVPLPPAEVPRNQDLLDVFAGPDRPATLGAFAILFAIAVALGALTWFWARSIGLSTNRASRWALFVFSFGLPGLLTFRLAADWPTRLRCPKCGSKRPVETAACPECHQPWPAPEPNGSEIFDLAEN